MKCCLASLAAVLLAVSAAAEVQVVVRDTNGVAWIHYECTAGEVVRAFAMDVTVDRGQIVGVTNFFRGPSTADSRGYGIFPASFRDNITVSSGTNADWSASAYSPIAVVADHPAGTLPGLNSPGVTLELAAVWNPSDPGAVPPPSGTLCALQLSQPANVSIVANGSRGGIIAAPSDVTIVPQFTGALVGPAITGARLVDGSIVVSFQSGELETSPGVNGPWTGTGNRTGTHTETAGPAPTKFYRVHNH